jgi:tripartite tricarboxylate transporter family receptor
MKDFMAFQWYGVLAPAGTPAETVNLLDRDINKALALPDVKERFVSVTLDITPGTLADFLKLLEAEDRRWKKVVKEVASGSIESRAGPASLCLAVLAYVALGRSADPRPEAYPAGFPGCPRLCAQLTIDIDDIEKVRWAAGLQDQPGSHAIGINEEHCSGMALI